MDWKVIALIVSLCLNAVLLIRQFAGLLSDLKRLMERLAGWLLRRPMAFKRWRWWKKYRPSWEILNWGDLQIEFDGNNYHMELKVDMKFSNGNVRYKAQYAGLHSHFWIDVYHEGKGWEKPPYRLWEKEILHQKTLQPSGFEQITLVFETKTDVLAKPLIGNTASCKIGGEIYGEIETPHVSLWGKLEKKEKNKFSVNVVCKS